MLQDDVIYGKNKVDKIVNISVKDDTVFIYRELENGIECITEPYTHWIMSRIKHNDTFTKLKGNAEFSWFKEYRYSDYKSKAEPLLYKLGLYTIRSKQENFMTRSGYTYFKNMRINEVSLLSFDIETKGFDPYKKDAKVFLITNTYRSNKGEYESKTFSVANYPSEKEMIVDWCDWVREKNPSLLIGYNIVIFDFPYLLGRAEKLGVSLNLGRNGEEIERESRTREFRVDGSQTLTYNRLECFGREIVDVFFLVVKTDIGKKYVSYALKKVIAQENMEKEGRQHYDASLIAKNWDIPEERAKIIAYAEEDSRDPIKLYDLKVSTVFYASPVVPKPFQSMMESASGSQINSLLLRAYIQEGYGVPSASEVGEFQGAISFGVPGVYKNMLKLDFSALYPSIMREYKLYDKKKDPLGVFLMVVEYFHEYRQIYKRKYIETGDSLYDDQQNVAKTIANSCYGFLAAAGLQFNSPSIASFITAKARELLSFSIEYFSSRTTESWIQEFNLKCGNTKEEEDASNID